jgi:hypothetical protein
VGSGRRRGAVELLEEGATGDAEPAHRPRVERREPLPDRRVQLGDRGELAVTQGREDPPLGHAHVRFDDRLVPGMSRAGGYDGGAVGRGELQVGAIDDGLVAAGGRDAAAEVIGHDDRGRPAEELDHPHVGADPRGQVLRGTRLGVHVAARPQHADEQLDRDQRARGGVDDHRPLAGEVHEGLLAGAMDLAHRGRQRVRPLVVVPTELAVAIPVGMLLEVLEVEPLQGHPGPLELLVDPGHIGQRPGHPDDVAHPLEEPGFKLGVVPLGRQRPPQVCLPSPAAVLRHRAQPHAVGPGDGPVGQALLVLESKNLADLSHR